MLKLAFKKIALVAGLTEKSPKKLRSPPCYVLGGSVFTNGAFVSKFFIF